MRESKMNNMKKIISVLLATLMAAALFTSAYAEEYTPDYADYADYGAGGYSDDGEDGYSDDSEDDYSEGGGRFYEFILSCGGESAVSAQKGETFTVTLNIKYSVDEAEAETAAEETVEAESADEADVTQEKPLEAEMTAFQDEICYDGEVLELLPDSFTLADGVEAVDMQTDEYGRRIRVSYIIPEPDKPFPQNTEIMSFDFRVLDAVGEVSVTQENYFVTTDDGLDVYDSDANDLAVNTEEYIPPECSVVFDTLDGAEYEELTVEQGSAVQEPESVPVREGYVFAGWYTDSACTEPYDFTQTVEESLTLYAKWDEAEKPAASWPVYAVSALAVIAAAAAVVIVRKKKAHK